MELECRFMDVGQTIHMGQQPLLILNHLQGRIGMHNRVIPGRHLFGVLSFFGIPGGRDVVLITCKDRKRIHCRGKVAPLRVGPRDVAPSVRQTVSRHLRTPWEYAKQTGHALPESPALPADVKP